MQEECCQPGDVTITQTTGGFRLSRVLPGHTAAAPWWEFVKVVPSRDEAVRDATALAAASAGRAWLKHDGDVYELMTVEASTTSDSVVVDTGSASSSDLPFIVDAEPG